MCESPRPSSCQRLQLRPPLAAFRALKLSSICQTRPKVFGCLTLNHNSAALRNPLRGASLLRVILVVVSGVHPKAHWRV